MQGNTGERPNAFTGPRLKELGSIEFRGYERTVYESLQDRHLFLFDQYPQIFQPQHPVAIGNLAASAYDIDQDRKAGAVAQGALGQSGLQYEAQPTPVETEVAPLTDAERMAAEARATIAATTSDRPAVEMTQSPTVVQAAEQVLTEAVQQEIAGIPTAFEAFLEENAATSSEMTNA